MNSRFSRAGALTLLSLAVAACGTDPSGPEAKRNPSTLAEDPKNAVALGLSDGQGTTWRLLGETVGLSWNQLAAVCPRDGINPCWAVVGGRNLNGWVWATEDQVLQLFARYEPAILTSRSLSGQQYGASAGAILTDFGILAEGGCSGYICSFGAFTSGWTSTSTTYGTAMAGSASVGFSALPSISLVSDANVNVVGLLRGHFMWRADGTGGTAIVANDDAGSVAHPAGAVAVANVLANDSLAGAPATLGTVAITPTGSSNPSVTLDPSTGAVSVAYGLRPGAYSLTYRICETARPANCDGATVAVTVAGNVVDAVDDAGSAYTGGGVAVPNVLANDTFAGGQATLSNVTVRQVGTHPQLSLSGAAVILAPNTPTGSYSTAYEICESGVPTNCDQATIRVTVANYQIDANSDQGSIQSYPGGTAIPNVLANDTFSGGQATLGVVTLTQLSTTHAGVTLDLTDGSVDVVAGTPGGKYTVMYRICEIAYATNCDDSQAVVTVLPQSYVVSNRRHRIDEGKGGTYTVALSQPPTSNVTVNLSYLGGTMNVTYSPAVLTFTPANWNTPQTVTYSTIRDSDKIDNAGTLQLTAAGIANVNVVIDGIDRDRKSTNPQPTLQLPENGQTVSGLLYVRGTATGVGLVDGKFSVDANRYATVVGSTGTYNAPAWDSRTVPNGWHTLEFRVTDGSGNDGRVLVSIYVSN